MKYAEISKVFSDKVAEFLANGFVFNLSTMSGTQGEIAKAHLTDGKEVYAIYLDTFSEFSDEDPYVFEGVELVVGKCVDKVRINNRDDILWNSHLKVVEKVRFYRPGRFSDSDFYTTKEEYVRIKKLQSERRGERNSFGYKRVNLPEEAKSIVMPWLKRQPRCKSVKISDITNVCKAFYNKSWAYEITAKGKTYSLSV